MQGSSTILLEDRTSAFIVRIWIEQREVAGAPVPWRGSIEHVASGESRYVTNLDEITGFVRPFLEAMGVDFTAPTS